MQKHWQSLLLILCLCSRVDASVPITQWVDGNSLQRNYPEALTSLASSFNHAVGSDINPSIQYIETISETVKTGPILYINAGDVKNWPHGEKAGLIRSYVEHGGFVWIDAGLQPPFIQGPGQSYSYAAWQPAPA